MTFTERLKAAVARGGDTIRDAASRVAGSRRNAQPSSIGQGGIMSEWQDFKKEWSEARIVIRKLRIALKAIEEDEKKG
jgi:hypothetical protein